jgi:hypothetical protein
MEWTDFRRVHKANRAKVALALEFDHIILAVLSYDLLVQVNLGALHHKDITLLPVLVSMGKVWII